MLTARGELISRQRPDIGLESYFATRVQLTPGLSYEFFRSASIALGVGGKSSTSSACAPWKGAAPPEG